MAERGKGVNMTSKVLHQAGWINEMELCKIANLIYPNDISIFGRERERKSPRKKIWFVFRLREQKAKADSGIGFTRIHS